MIACVGGGSNAAGAFYHYLNDEHVNLVGVEAAGHGVDSGESAATLALGNLAYCTEAQDVSHADRGWTSDRAVLNFGRVGLSIASARCMPTFDVGRVNFISATDDESMEAGIELAKLEGTIPAIESAHALAALKKLEFDKDDVVGEVNVSGRAI